MSIRHVHRQMWWEQIINWGCFSQCVSSWQPKLTITATHSTHKLDSNSEKQRQEMYSVWRCWVRKGTQRPVTSQIHLWCHIMMFRFKKKINQLSSYGQSVTPSITDNWALASSVRVVRKVTAIWNHFPGNKPTPPKCDQHQELSLVFLPAWDSWGNSKFLASIVLIVW